MEKFLILLVSMASLAAAGTLENRWIVGGRTRQTNEINRDTDPILRMSSDQLHRQMFLLKILEQVHQPIIDETLIRIADTFVSDQSRYIEGIDRDMMYVIELSQNTGLLGKNDIFSISNPEHIRQMIGLNRLMVRSVDWETFQKNVCCARMHVNGVLFVNALLLAVREREDTRILVVPSIYEILPEIYVDKDIVRIARNIDMNLLTHNTEREIIRPNLLDVIGLGGRKHPIGMMKSHEEGMWPKSRMWMPWREMRMQIAMQKNQNTEGLITTDIDDKIIIPVQKTSDSIRDVNLITEDVALNGFIHLMINNLCLLENELQNIQMNRVGITSKNAVWNHLGARNDDRLVGQRREVDTEREDDRWTARANVVNGRRVINREDNRRVNILNIEKPDESERWSQWIPETDRYWDPIEERRQEIHASDDWTRVPSSPVDNDRLVHINRRRINSADNIEHITQEPMDVQDRTMHTIYGSRIHDIRRTMPRDDDKWQTSTISSSSPRRWQSYSGADIDSKIGHRNLMHEIEISDLPTIPIDDERLLHVNRRRLPSIDDVHRDTLTQRHPQNLRNRFMSIIHWPTVNDARHSIERNDVNEANRPWESDIRRGNMWTMSNRDEPDINAYVSENRDSDRLESRLDGIRKMKEIYRGDDLSTKSINDNRLLHINRRRLLGHNRDISDVRQVKHDNIWSDRWNEMWNKDRTEDLRMIGIRKSNIENDRLLHVNRRHMNDESINTEGDVRHRRVRDIRRTVEKDTQEVNRLESGSDVLLHNIMQTLARIEMDRISLESSNTIRSNNERESWQLDQSRNLNNVRNTRVNTDIIMDIENTIQNLLNRVQVGRNEMESIALDRRIADILMGQEEDINILNIIRDLVVNTRLTSNVQSLQDLGIDLKNTAVRDVLQRLNEAIDMHRTRILGAYTPEDLNFNGITINDVKIDNLKTFVDRADIDITNLIDSRTHLIGGDHKMIVARQQRLNHKDFTIKIDLDSDRTQRVLVRTMIGPKLTDNVGRLLTINERRHSFVLIDTNIVDLQTGKNVIKRKSRDIMWTARDTTPISKIYQRVMMADNIRVNKEDVIPTTRTIGQDCRFPHHLLLPRGRLNGMPMELLVIITPVTDNIWQHDDRICAMGVGTVASDNHSLGFPLDRHIDNVRDVVTLPNVRVIDVLIRHDNMQIDV